MRINKNIKKTAAIVLSTALGISALTGCGTSKEGEADKNTQASAADTDSDNGPVGHDLKSIVGSPLVQKLISEAASSTGDSGAQASADVDGNNVIISITLSRAVPDGAEQAAAAQSGDISSYTDDLRKQLAILSSDENVTVTVRVFDTTGKQIV